MAKKREITYVTDSEGRIFKHTPVTYKVFGRTYHTTNSVEVTPKRKKPAKKRGY